MLIFGDEFCDFARRLMYVVLVAGILLGANQIVGLFGASGASIGDITSSPRAGRGGRSCLSPALPSTVRKFIARCRGRTCRSEPIESSCS